MAVEDAAVAADAIIAHHALTPEQRDALAQSQMDDESDEGGGDGSYSFDTSPPASEAAFPASEVSSSGTAPMLTNHAIESIPDIVKGQALQA